MAPTENTSRSMAECEAALVFGSVCGWGALGLNTAPWRLHGPRPAVPHTYVHAHGYMHMSTCTCLRAHVYTHVYTNVHTHVCADVYTHGCAGLIAHSGQTHSLINCLTELSTISCGVCLDMCTYIFIDMCTYEFIDMPSDTHHRMLR